VLERRLLVIAQSGLAWIQLQRLNSTQVDRKLLVGHSALLFARDTAGPT
jgi:hypothetical protein